MADLFIASPGQAVRVVGSGGNGGLPLAIDGASGSWFPSFRALLTEVSLGLDGSFQCAHTLDNLIYIYIFGDRISQMRLGGMTLAAGCPAGGPGGIERILDLYDENRIAARRTPVQVQIGAGSAGRFRALMTALRIEVARPEFGLGNFSIGLHVLPRSRSLTD